MSEFALQNVDKNSEGITHKVWVEEWHIKNLLESISNLLEQNHNNWSISEEEYIKQRNEIIKLFNEQNLERSLLIKKYKELESLVLKKSENERKEWWEDSFIVNMFKWWLYKVISIDKDLEKNDPMQNFTKWVIDELISLPELVEVLIRDSNARKQFIDWIKNLTWEQVKDTFFDWVWNIASWDAYETWKSAVFTILLLTWLGGLAKSGASVAWKIASKTMSKTWIKSIEKSVLKTVVSATDDTLGSTWKIIWKQTIDLTENVWKSIIKWADELSLWNKTFWVVEKSINSIKNVGKVGALSYATATWLWQQGVNNDYTTDNSPKNSSDNFNYSKYKDFKNPKNISESEKNAEKFLYQDIEESALDILDETYNPTSPWDRKFLRLFKKIPLDKIYEAHDKSDWLENIDDVIKKYDSYIDIIMQEYIGDKFKKYRWVRQQSQLSQELRNKIIKLAKARTQVLFYNIGEFLRKEKWSESEKLVSNKKRYKYIWDLINNNTKFNEFIKGKKSIITDDVWYNEFKSNQINWLYNKLNSVEKDIDLMYPKWLYYDVDYGSGIVTKSIGYKWNNFPEDKRWFYIWWYKYKLDWVNDITSIWIDWDDLVIKWNIYWKPNSEIKLSKTSFAEWISDLLFKWYQKVPSTDLKKEITIQRDIVV